MPTGSQRTGAGPYAQYFWDSRTTFSLVVQPSVWGKSGQVVSYSLSPAVAWTATPRVLRFKRSGKEGAISWSLA